MYCRKLLLVVNATLVALLLASARGLQQASSNVVGRRQAIQSWVATAIATTELLQSRPALAADEDSDVTTISFENRNRNGNKDAVIRDDYWFMFGKTPPRLLTTSLKGDDPQWNAFGSCTQADGGNSCTYVSLQLRIPAYSKYGSSISYGAREYAQLGKILQKLDSNNNNPLWDEAASYVQTPPGSVPPAAVDAELKMVLFATAMTTSPNFPTPGKELLVARYYANEVRFANRALARAIEQRASPARCRDIWAYGRDAWNSYFQVVNRSVSPKVGDKFEAIV